MVCGQRLTKLSCIYDFKCKQKVTIQHWQGSLPGIRWCESRGRPSHIHQKNMKASDGVRAEVDQATSIRWCESRGRPSHIHQMVWEQRSTKSRRSDQHEMCPHKVMYAHTHTTSQVHIMWYRNVRRCTRTVGQSRRMQCTHTIHQGPIM
jgi:hypothetical protein